jgi:hypothetical protein
VDPDEFYVHEPTFNGGFRAVLSRRLGKKKPMIYAQGHATTGNVKTPPADRKRFCIGDNDVLALAQTRDRRGCGVHNSPLRFCVAVAFVPYAGRGPRRQLRRKMRGQSP